MFNDEISRSVFSINNRTLPSSEVTCDVLPTWTLRPSMKLTALTIMGDIFAVKVLRSDET